MGTEPLAYGISLAFWIHFIVYVIVSLILVAANAITLFFPPWCLFPILGWGIGIAIHAIVTFALYCALGYEDPLASKLKVVGARANDVKSILAAIGALLTVLGFVLGQDGATEKIQKLSAFLSKGSTAKALKQVVDFVKKYFATYD